jgi:hypothetical protein
MTALEKAAIYRRLMLAACSIFALGSAPAGAVLAASGTTFEGKAVHIGKGTGRIVVRADPGGRPTSVAVKLTSGSLEGLPSELNKASSEGQWEYVLPMPAKGPRTGYRHVVVDWNPQGHPPPGVYTVPHFDFHFYTVSRAEVAKVAFKGPADPAAVVSNARLVAAGYQVVAETVVNKMGVHAIDTTAPEFHGKPFTATFIYGYYKGRLTFVEPMVTHAFLLGKPNFSAEVRTPAEYSHTGYYPTRYAVRYDARQEAYFVELLGLKRGGKSAQNQSSREKGR